MILFFKTTLLGLVLAAAGGLLVACGGGSSETGTEIRSSAESGGLPEPAAAPEEKADPDAISEHFWIDEHPGEPLVPAESVSHDALWAIGNPTSMALSNPAIRQHLLIRDEASWRTLLADAAVNLSLLGGAPGPVVDFNTQQVLVLGWGSGGLSVPSKILRAGGVLQVLVSDKSEVPQWPLAAMDANLMVLVLPMSEEVRVTRHLFPGGLIPLEVQTDAPLLSQAEPLMPVFIRGAEVESQGTPPFDPYSNLAYLIPDWATWRTYFVSSTPDEVLAAVDFNTHNVLAISTMAMAGYCMAPEYTVLASGNVLQVTTSTRQEERDVACPAVFNPDAVGYHLLMIPRSGRVQLNRLRPSW